MKIVTERRWIVLIPDGRYTTLGRHTDPTEEEILAIESRLLAQGLTGWLAVTNGSFWSRKENVSVMMVKPLASPNSSFEEAIKSFQIARIKKTEPSRSASA